MDAKGKSVYILFEETKIPIETLTAICEGTYDYCDSLPISMLEVALGISLNHF